MFYRRYIKPDNGSIASRRAYDEYWKSRIHWTLQWLLIGIVSAILIVAFLFGEPYLFAPYSFHPSLPTEINVVDLKPFVLTIEGDENKSEIRDTVHQTYTEYLNDTFIKRGTNKTVEYGGHKMLLTKYETERLSGKGIVVITNIDKNKGASAGLSVKIGEKNYKDVICEQWYDSAKFSITDIEINGLIDNIDENVADVTIKFNHFAGKIKRPIEEIEMQIWLKDSKTTNINIKSVSETEYKIISSEPLMKVKIDNKNIETTEGKTLYTLKINKNKEITLR